MELLPALKPNKSEKYATKQSINLRTCCFKEESVVVAETVSRNVPPG